MSGINYHAYLVANSGRVDYISDVTTFQNAKELVKYWTRGKWNDIWGKSFVEKGKAKYEEGDYIR